MTAIKKTKQKNEPSFKIETITPGEAQQILEGNTNNRRLSSQKIEDYGNQLKRGIWQVNGESVKIDERGYLLDGQHRLWAIVKSGIPMTTFVVRNLPSETFVTIDAGKTRTIADYLKIDGFKEVNHNILAASCRIAGSFDVKTGIYKATTKKVLPTDAIYFCNLHAGLIESVKFSERMKKVTSQSVAAGCHYIFSVVDPESAHTFFEAVATGEALSQGNPALTVRNRLMSVRADRRAGSAYQRMIIAYLVQAFNYYRSKQKLNNSVYNQGSDIVLNDFVGSMK